MTRNINELLQEIKSKNKMQGAYLDRYLTKLTQDEIKMLDTIIEYFKSKNETIASIADAYLLIVQSYIEEQYYFMNTGHYRYSKYEEVCNLVYYNHEYMHKYMLMQNISHYLFKNHLSITRYIKQFYISNPNLYGKYLEVGPGYGGYFLLAMIYTNMDYYYGIDLSETSVNGSIDFIKKNIDKNNFNITLHNFFDCDIVDKYNFIVSTEVLEHVENPEKFLCKFTDILENDGMAFVTTAINAPALDHIYLFKNKEEIFNMANNAGLKVVDYVCSTSNRRSVEYAEEHNEPIVIGLLLKHIK